MARQSRSNLLIFAMGICALSFATACNNGSETKTETTTDSMEKVSMPPAMPAADTNMPATPPATRTAPAMDTADTRPVKPGN